jgi:hypothetical protein
MPTQHHRRRLRNDFNLGAEEAEGDQLLETGFYESGNYHTVKNHNNYRPFIIGRTGSGKSALLRRLEIEFPDHVIRIDPEDLSLRYITNNNVMKYLGSIENLKLDSLFIVLWKHVLIVEVIRHRYGITSPDDKQTFIRSIMEKIQRDAGKKMALEYLSEFEGKFWHEADQRIKDVMIKFEERIDKEARAFLGITRLAGLKSGVGSLKSVSTEIRGEEVERYQAIINESQIPRLNKMVEVLRDDILNSDQNYTYVVIDDLDRDWEDERVSNDLIRCLFRAVRDLRRVQNLKILVALRTNIFEELDFGGPNNGQEEKYRSGSLVIKWTRNELSELLSKRARAAAAQHSLEDVTGIEDLIPHPNSTRNALDYILNRTLMRPRDAIAYLNECLLLAGGKSALTWAIINSAEKTYSNNRLMALRDEWKPTYPSIDRLFSVFRRAPVPMSRDELRERLDEAALLLADPHFLGKVWMEKLTERIWDSKVRDWADEYHPLFRLLFDLGFLGCSMPNSDNEIYSYDQPGFAEGIDNLARSVEFFIHPAFRRALEVHEFANAGHVMADEITDD